MKMKNGVLWSKLKKSTAEERESDFEDSYYFRETDSEEEDSEDEKAMQKEEYEILEREIIPRTIVCPDCGGLTLEGLEYCDKCGGELINHD